MAISIRVYRQGIVRFRRMFPPFHHRIQPFSSPVTQTDAEETIEYPPIKPRWPPGSWGSMREKHAWEAWEKKVELDTNSLTVMERLKFFSDKLHNSWKFPMIQHYPDALHYQQDVTKTALLNGMPDYYDILEEEAMSRLPTIRTKVEEVLLLENDLLDRSNIRFEVPPHGAFKSHSIRSQLIDCLVRSLSADYPHLRTCQYGECVKVKAFWDRHGYPLLPSIFKSDDGDDKQSSYRGKMYTRFHTDFTCSHQLRSEMPLKPFVDHFSPLCTETPYPLFKYWPKDLSQFKEWVKTTCVPGYLHGDPCQFGLLAMDCPMKLYRRQLKYEKDIVNDLQTGMGLVTMFAWTVAQAHYLGFNMHTELTFPLSSQMIITDGQKFSFFAYQLNTLEMWKDDDANPLRNLCWHQENLKLFEDIQDGQLTGFNDDVLKQIIKFFINQPFKPDYPLRPYLPPASNEETMYINF